MLKRAVKLMVVCATLIGLSTAAHAESKPAGDKADLEAAKTTLLEGLKVINAGKFDKWINDYCSEKYCPTPRAKSSIKKYNLPAMKRLTPKCLGDKGELRVKRVQDKGDDGKKIFIECDPRGMPRPFHLRKTDQGWRFDRI